MFEQTIQTNSFIVTIHFWNGYLLNYLKDKDYKYEVAHYDSEFLKVTVSDTERRLDKINRFLKFPYIDFRKHPEMKQGLYDNIKQFDRKRG